MSTKENAANVLGTSNEVAKNETQSTAATIKKAATKTTRKPRAKKPVVNAEEVETTEPANKKERAARVAKIDRVQIEICKQFGISETQFWKFMATHKPGKMNNNKFADALVQRAFFEREKLAEQLQG